MAQNERTYDYLIVGSGLFGSVFARRATDLGYRCLVIEKRKHPGGNVYCEKIEGINVHRYGAHIFHTSNRRIWEFVNRYVEFNRFTNAPIARAAGGKLINLPFNMNTFHAIWDVETPEEAQATLHQQIEKEIERMHLNGHAEPTNLEEQALTLVGSDIYRLLIKDYTEKQWGRQCRELPAFIIKRLPLRFVYDNNYFNDTYQGIPIGGYNELISRLLEGVDVRLGVDYFDDRNHWDSLATKTVFTGQIDQYFDYCYGHLQYRSLRFDTQVLDEPNFQGNAVVNYTSHEEAYTRIIEHKHFEMFGDTVYENPRTVITKEYPIEYGSGEEPFYPINDEKNQQCYEKYRKLAENNPRLILGGRLAEYKYYDMAPVIERALSMFD